MNDLSRDGWLVSVVERKESKGRRRRECGQGDVGGGAKGWMSLEAKWAE